MRFRLNSSSVNTGGRCMSGAASGVVHSGPGATDYMEYVQMGAEIKAALTQARQDVRSEAAAAAAPKTAVHCPLCGATTFPDANGRCEYCGGAVSG